MVAFRGRLLLAFTTIGGFLLWAVAYWGGVGVEAGVV